MNIRHRFIFGTALALVLASGTFGRIYRFGERPFWSDEAWVAHTVLSHDAAELFRQKDVPLPPLFSVTLKALNTLVRRPEVGLRLLPLFCGLALPVLVMLLAQSLRLARSVQLAATALAAANTMLVVWSRELKQYEVEAFLSVGMALLVFRLRYSRSRSSRIAGISGILMACLLGPWLGYGFVFAALPLLAILVLVRTPRAARRISIISGLCGALFLGVSTLTVLRFVASAQSSDPGLAQFASQWFINPLEPRQLLAAAIYFVFTSYLIIVPQYLAAVTMDQMSTVLFIAVGVWVCVLVGLFTWPRRTRTAMAIYVLGPWLLLLIAAVAGRYLFCNPRLMVMWVAGMMLPMGAGVVRIGRAITHVALGRGGPGIVLGMLIAMLPIGHLLVRHHAHTSWVRHDFPALLKIISEERQPDEPVIATLMASSATSYYAPQYGVEVNLMPSSGGTCAVPGLDYGAWVKRIIARTRSGRMWILVVDGYVPDPTRDKTLEVLDDSGFQVSPRGEDPDLRSWGTAKLLLATRGSAR